MVCLPHLCAHFQLSIQIIACKEKGGTSSASHFECCHIKNFESFSIYKHNWYIVGKFETLWLHLGPLETLHGLPGHITVKEWRADKWGGASHRIIKFHSRYDFTEGVPCNLECLYDVIICLTTYYSNAHLPGSCWTAHSSLKKCLSLTSSMKWGKREGRK